MGLIILSIVAIIYGLLRMLGKTSVSLEVRTSKHEKEYLKVSGLNYIILGVIWIILAFISNYFKLSSLAIIILAVVLALPALIIESKAIKKYLN